MTTILAEERGEVTRMGVSMETVGSMFSDFFPSEPVMHSVPALCSLVWK
jgi:hypothetical protein